MTVEPDTALTISGIGIPDYSARGLSQSHDPIDAAIDFDRTVNGELVNLADAQFHKYKSTITGKDVNPPALDGIFPGYVLTIGCLFELSYKTSGGSPNRPVVSGSSRTEGSHTFYRPELSVMLMNFSVSKNEWEAVVDWRLDVEEI